MAFARQTLFIGLLVIGFASLSGCTLGPDYQRPPVAVPPAYQEAAPWKESRPADSLTKGDWWQMFDDPILDRLEQQAMGHNPGLEVALARVLQARADLQIESADGLPRLDLNPSARRTRTIFEEFGISQGFTFNDFQVPLDLSYELDLWGRVRRAVEAADAEYVASQADFHNILLTLQADVARNYFSWRALDQQIDLLDQTIDLRRKNLDLVNSLFRNGQSGRLDVARAETELANAQADVAALKRQRAATEHALATLVGKNVADFSLARPSDLSVTPPAIAPDLPSTLLERRPDIAAAERRMMAANARIGVAKTAFFPSISLTGSAGYSSSELAELFDWSHRVWSLGPFISLPVFDGGRNRANLARSEAAWQQAVAQYRQQVLVAFREVEDALADLRILGEQAEAQARAVEAAQEAADLSRKRYRAGLVSYLEVVVSERTALATELLAVQVLEQRLQASISLAKALGGGWQEDILPDQELAAATRRPTDAAGL